jgi:hypothetical protein
MLECFDCTTSQQDLTQEATRGLDELNDDAHDARQSPSHRGSTKEGNEPAASLKLLSEARNTDNALKLDGIEPTKRFEDTSTVESMGSAPITCSRVPVSELLEILREDKLGKYMMLFMFQNRSVVSCPKKKLLERDTKERRGKS